ncbi:MAG: ferric reductase-like transmembrane domain-containing protein [Rhizobiaceae bacterium]|nr:ferric reductase-like transmembrane domain-containing protein [Rhizobiaceae bacterium]MCV0406099.1 ferric reductase-like transmembrane domain-containing protein [Rhizobiaceae bacterium]
MLVSDRTAVPESLKRLAASRRLPWLLLALPAAPMLWPVLAGDEPWRHAIAPSGLFAAQLVAAALAVSPLRAIFPRSGLVTWMQRHRRALGVAAFCYGVVHLLAFVMAIGRLDYILQGLAFASMQTGWAAFLLILPVAAISSDFAMRRLGPWWKRVQRLVYPVAILTLAHWLLLVPSPVTPLVWCGAVAALQLLRLWKARRSSGG